MITEEGFHAAPFQFSAIALLKCVLIQSVAEQKSCGMEKPKPIASGESAPALPAPPTIVCRAIEKNERGAEIYAMGKIGK